MADREIRVVGVFQDGITPTLNKLNRQLLGTLKQFEKLQRKIAPVAQGMERIGEASATLTNNLKGQRGAIEENIRMLRQYRTELGKTATAQQRMGGRLPKAVTPTEPTGGARPRRRPFFTPQPAFVPPRTIGGGYGAELGAGVFGMTLGSQLAGIITGAVVSGFQTGARIMTAPFNYGAKAIGERIRDEMSDVRTAGGLFSISRRMQKPLFGTFAEAEEYTKEQNRYLAKLAGSLPGNTQEYIQVSKQIADGIFTIVSQDSASAVKLATQLAQTRGASAEEIAKLTAGGPAAQRQAGKELVGEMTKLTVLAGLGGQQGAYGLPQLTERMFAEEQVSMGMFQRYAAIFRDPMIKGALERNIDKINKTGKNTTARLDAIRETYAQIVTPDLVRRYQRTTAGVLESLRTTFLNPEVGLLGLGRPLGKAVQKFNEFGQAVGELGDETVPLANTFEKNGKLYGYVIDKMGRVTDKFVEVSMEQISIFDRLRDVFANVMIVLEPILNNLASFFDPLLGIGASLDDVRKATMWFQSTFERYRVTMMKEAERLSNKELRAQFEGTVPMRSAFQALNNAMVELGAYGDDQFKELSKVIIDPKTKVEEFGNVLRTIVDKFLGSDAAKRIGETIGMIVGTVIAQVGEMMKAAAGLATASKLAEGFAAGFQAAGGPQGFRDIIRSVFALFGKLLIEVIKAAPLETAIAAALFFLPGAIAGLVTTALTGAFAALTTNIGSLLPKIVLPGPKLPGAPGPKGGGYLKVFDNIALAGQKVSGAIKTAGLGFVKVLRGLSGMVKGIVPTILYGMQKIRAAFQLLRIGQFGAVFKGLLTPLKAVGSGFKGFLGMLGKGVKSLGKFGGIVTAVVAAFDFFGALLSGKDIWESLGTAAGPVVGTIIGAALTPFFPPLGAAIGSLIGSMEPVQSFFIGLFRGIGEAWGQIWPDIQSSLGSIVEIFSQMFSAVGNLIGMFGGLGQNMSALDVIIIATKIALQPVVFTFNLLEQTLNVIVLAFKALNAAILWARVGLAKLNPKNFFEASDELKKLEEEARTANQAVATQWDKIGDTYNRHNEYHKNLLSVQRQATAEAIQNTKKFSEAAAAAGSTFENNKKYTDEAGKSWGWAMMNGEKVMVEWGSVAGTALKNLTNDANQAATNLAEYQQKAREDIAANRASSLKATAAEMDWYHNQMASAGGALNNLSANANQAATNLAEYQKKTREAIAQGTVSGLNPTAQEKAWYNEMMRKQGGKATAPSQPPTPPVGAAPAPAAASPIPALQALNTKQAETNALLTQINAKTVPQETVNPVPQLRAIATKLSGANAFLAQVKVQVMASEKELKSQVGASSDNIQAKIQGTTDAVKDLPSRFRSGIPVRIIGTPTVRFDMGGMGPVGGGIGGFAKTSGYGMRWGKMHTGNDYAMPVGTKLGIGGPGKVLFAGDAGGYGKMMDIGGPGGMVYRFAHLSKFNAPVGATLPPGFPFALSGNTGRSTGPHLHFEARPGGIGPINPDSHAGMIRAAYEGLPIGGLLEAAKIESQKMPYGSNLIVANSSETIIPAFGGYKPREFTASEKVLSAFGGYKPREFTASEKVLTAFGGYKPRELVSTQSMSAAFGGPLSFNTDEIYMRPTQTASLIESSTRAGVTSAGNFEVGSVEVTINDNTGDITKVSDQAAEMILQSMYRQSRAEVITS